MRGVAVSTRKDYIAKNVNCNLKDRGLDFNFVNERNGYNNTTSGNSSYKRNPYERYIASRDKKRRERRMKQIIKLLLIVPLVVLVGLLFFGSSAKGQDDIRESKNDYYHELENRYMDVLREELSRKGMGSAGVTMTSVIDINGDRSYNVQLHHEKISKMDENQQCEFMNFINGISFADSTIPVAYEILY